MRSDYTRRELEHALLAATCDLLDYDGTGQIQRRLELVEKWCKEARSQITVNDIYSEKGENQWQMNSS